MQVAAAGASGPILLRNLWGVVEYRPSPCARHLRKIFRSAVTVLTRHAEAG